MPESRPTSPTGSKRRSPVETLLDDHPGLDDQPGHDDQPGDDPVSVPTPRRRSTSGAAKGTRTREGAARRSGQGRPSAKERNAKDASRRTRTTATDDAEQAADPASDTSASRRARHAAGRAADVSEMAEARMRRELSASTLVLPPVQDVALGLLALMAEQTWRTGDRVLGLGRRAVVRWVSLVRAVSPSIATKQVDARIEALAERGRRVREERSGALTEAMSAAFLTVATSDAARTLTVAAVDTVIDDLLPLITPRMLEVMREEEIEAAIDEMMAGLLVRQLPDAMERIAPIMLMRTATRPTSLVPNILGGVLPR